MLLACLPIRPSPMNPHVAHLALLVAKVLRAAVAAVVVFVEAAVPPLPSKQSFEGEKRIEIAAFMVAPGSDAVAKWTGAGGRRYGGEEEGGRREATGWLRKRG